MSLHLQVVTNSEMGEFRTCRMRWWLKYDEGLRAPLGAPAMTWGNCVHAGCETGYQAAYRGNPNRGDLSAAIEGAGEGVERYHQEFEDRVEAAVDAGLCSEDVAHERIADGVRMRVLAHWAVPNFFRATEEDLESLVPMAFEMSFEVPVSRADGKGGALRHAGKIDGIWWDPRHKQIILDDHKTLGGSSTVGALEKRLLLDPQMSGYQHAVRWLVRHGKLGLLDGTQLGPTAWRQTGRSRYNAIRRSLPSQPKVNKAKAKKDDEAGQRLVALEKQTGEPQGLVSVAAIDTTAEVYRAALEAQEQQRGLAVTDAQRDVLEGLERRERSGNAYFARYEFWRSLEDLELWRREFWTEAALMRRTQRETRYRTRNPGACTMANSLPCSHQAVCLDDGPETRALYRRAEKRHEEV